MNNDTCSTTETFGQTIKPGTPVTITLREAGVSLEGKVSGMIAPYHESGSFRLDGMRYSNRFYAQDIDVSVVEPPIEPGFYLNQYGVIFLMTGDPKAVPRVAHLPRMAKGRDMPLSEAFSPESSYHKEIREGKTVRIADAYGTPVSA